MSAKSILVYGSVVNPIGDLPPGNINVVADGYLSRDQEELVREFARQRIGWRAVSGLPIELRFAPEDGAFPVPRWIGEEVPEAIWVQRESDAWDKSVMTETLCLALKRFRRIDDLWEAAQAAGNYFLVFWDGIERSEKDRSPFAFEQSRSSRQSLMDALRVRTRRGWTGGAAHGDVVDFLRALRDNPTWWPFNGDVGSVSRDGVSKWGVKTQYGLLLRELSDSRRFDNRAHYMRPEGEVL